MNIQQAELGNKVVDVYYKRYGYNMIHFIVTGEYRVPIKGEFYLADYHGKPLKSPFDINNAYCAKSQDKGKLNQVIVKPVKLVQRLPLVVEL